VSDNENTNLLNTTANLWEHKGKPPPNPAQFLSTLKTNICIARFSTQ